MKPIVIKIGGSTLGSEDTTIEDLVALQKKGMPLVVVHGGAKLVSEWLAKHGITTRFVDGLRVTDIETLKVVTAVLAGLVNKQLVAGITTRGGKAVGLSGADGSLIQARIKQPELGYTGEIVGTDPTIIKAALAHGYMPVIAPVSLLLQDGGKEEGALGLVNVNGDTAAGEIALVLGAQRLVFLTDVAGIYNGSGKLISYLSREEAQALITSRIASSGMIPKIEACLRAIPEVKVVRVIDGRVPHVLLREIEGKGDGTTVGKKR